MRNILIQLFIIILPWCLRRWLLQWLCGYKLHPSSHIGLSILAPQRLCLDEGATISHFNVAVHLDYIHLKKKASIGRGNWITGFSTRVDSKHFAHDTNRRSELILGDESAITKNHHIDCTNYIHIGNYVTIAGYNSQLLTHSIDVYKCRQDSHPIVIGDYSFVSTGVKILGGSALPAHSVLAAGAVLNKQYNEEWMLYGGVPAKGIKKIPQSALYFTRESGYVY